MYELTNFYFAYGADMSPRVLRDRGVRAEAIAIAQLCDFELAFFGHSWVWDSGQETLVERHGASVWGVLYQLTSLDWERLDDWMGARLDGAGAYFHYPSIVRTPSGEPHHVRFYKKDILRQPTLPSDAYLAQLIEGARYHCLPSGYIAQLEQLPVHKADPTVPRSGNARRVGKTPDCRTCDLASREGSGAR